MYRFKIRREKLQYHQSLQAISKTHGKEFYLFLLTHFSNMDENRK